MIVIICKTARSMASIPHIGTKRHLLDGTRFPAMGFEGLSRSTRAGRPAPPYHQPTDPELVGTGILPGEDFQLASLAVAHPTRGSQLRSSLLTSNANPRFLVDPAMAPDHEAKRAVSSSSSFRV